MKKIISIFIVICFLVFSAINVNASDMKLMLDGEYVDATPIIIDDRCFLPIRDTVELLGGSVDWNGEKRQSIISKGDTSIVLTMDSMTAIVNGDIVDLDVPAQIVNGKAMGPLRFVGISLGVTISYQEGLISISTTENDIAAVEQKVQLPVAPAPATISSPIELPEPVVVPIVVTNSNDKFNVFWGKTGNKVHIKPNCSTIKNGVLTGSIKVAVAEGRTEGWCGVCSKGWTNERLASSGNPNIKLQGE